MGEDEEEGIQILKGKKGKPLTNHIKHKEIGLSMNFPLGRELTIISEI
jgi:hypothetical protein